MTEPGNLSEHTSNGPLSKGPSSNGPLTGRKILLGITGGIAAYKTPMLVRALVADGAQVQPVLTQSAAEFVTPTTLQAVAGVPVRTDLWDAEAEAAMGHIELARWADLIVIAPATANFLVSLAQGAAHNLLTTLCLATRAPILVVPAMNQVMWENPATQANVAVLKSRGIQCFGPADGAQACGEYGPGRMEEPADIAAHIDRLINQAAAIPSSPTVGSLAGYKLLITAGPTREAIDPVRYISNHSSGKQGYALAAAAAAQGAEVTLVSGPVNLSCPIGVERVSVESAQQMFEAVMARLASTDIMIGVAAVADYRPAARAEQKIKKNQQADPGLALSMVLNPDIIAAVAKQADGPFCVGFAAETQTPLEHARAKRVRKGLSAIVVNDVSNQDIGFNSDNNAVTLIWDEGELTFPEQNKQSLAAALIEKIAAIFVDQLANTNHAANVN